MSCLVDVMIAGYLCYFLQSNRNASSSMDRVINAVILYTFENNSLTSAATIVSMIAWLTMPHNLVFMGLHVIISKLYSNSLLATLNTRKQLQHERSLRGVSGDLLPVAFHGYAARYRNNSSASRAEPATTKLEINVDKNVHYDVDVTLSQQHDSPSSGGTHVVFNEGA
ncbi:hypothetical protein BU15DRAFT_76278 [Melanogaster broomeanus]|nr:hypothetical protein BU15DRAFT_76278 [Melanogaster broomeanus]